MFTQYRIQKTRSVMYQELTTELEPSREVGKRVKIDLEDNKAAFAPNKDIEVDNQTSLKDTFHERAKPEAEAEEVGKCILINIL